MQAPVHRYPAGMPYRRAAGRRSPSPAVEDRLARQLAVIDLESEQPSPTQFLRRIRRELKIRCYAERTIKTYLQAARSILRWLGRRPEMLTREHVRGYLEYLYDAGHGPSELGVQLSAIRTIWDKFCYRDVTLGLETPRKKRTRPVVLSRDEVVRLLEACSSVRDTLLIGLMYGTGMRVGEVCRVRWRDIDIDRSQIFIHQGKGGADRHVQLPKQYRTLLQKMKSRASGGDYLFATENSSDRRPNRHLSPRTVQRLLRKACEMAGIQKKATPHSLRHAFATHSFEDGCDIRRIQKVLGHVRLDTTTIYVTVASQRTAFTSPLDRLSESVPAGTKLSPSRDVRQDRGTSPQSDAKSVGVLRLHLRPHPDDQDADLSRRRYQITLEIVGHGFRHFLTGTVAQQSQKHLVKIDFPSLEDWQPVIERLPRQVAERMDSTNFYHLLQKEITRRVLNSNQRPSETINQTGPDSNADDSPPRARRPEVSAVT